MSVTVVPRPERVSTGIAGLDAILGGGLPRNRLHVVQGNPGTGKTTLALHFLLDGVRAGESVLFITLSETREELQAIAQSHGWSLEGVLVAQHGLLGVDPGAPIDLSYLSDTVLLLRFFEHSGAVHKAISVMKKRGGAHEQTIRELKMTSSGLRLGQPLSLFEGVLTGTPSYTGTGAPLLHEEGQHGD